MLRFPIAHKIAAGYVLVSLLCLAGVAYALAALSQQTRLNEELVRVDFALMEAARDLRANLLSQERLERQILILRDPQLADLLAGREKEYWELETRFFALASARDQSLALALRETAATIRQGRQLRDEERWDEAAEFAPAVLSPQRYRLMGQLEQFLQRREQALDQQLQSLLTQSRRAFRLTLALTFCGISLAVVVGTWGSYRIHQAVRRLTGATKDIAAGSFDVPPALDTADEFGQLARDFHEMGQKLKELDRLRLDANPLTHLPGNLAIEREIEKRIQNNLPFAAMYVDLDHFKAFNDRYGFQAGSDVLARVGELVQQAVENHGSEQDLAGHIGGDDYIILTLPERAEAIAQALITDFDRDIPQFYTDEDRQRGYFVSTDRFDVERRFPLLTMSVAIVTSASLKNPTPEAIGRECAKIKEHLKKLPGSNILLDRREQR
ncbi:GGDEF domain-containing protein [Geoalkalibacter halelectricus]|uniref:diguanylate cyclase n=1 Tax=Geoalkalibacter halelectricus TaxID=2847045 RepID=A0ABY5ZP94_9BACT|nr:diguanylate cyclase [Geoalkalibacter halelectricus]MDO3379209.1 diguanylate cyclase [Geoalkalibacter halelectricus]UWZ80967.1 diguanylate cyclase [Geoalkalibacter halelectricus]